jgi:nucleoside-diphosphate-sugar epimerase
VNVLITGAFGNLGTNALKKLVEQKHHVRCFDLETGANRKKASKYKSRFGDQIEVVWGDVRNNDDVAAAVRDRDVVVHLSFIMPPGSDDRPEWAREVNVGGTQKLIAAMKAQPNKPRIIFSSSFTVFGDTQAQEPPRRVTDPVVATDNYTAHKIECEKLCAESGLDWCVMRFGVVPPVSLGGVTPKMFAFPFKSRTEFAHPTDVGLAIANAVSSEEVWGKILLIGSGKDGQLYYGDFVNQMMEVMGVGRLPEEAFGSETAYMDWLDTEESQQLLQYQQHTFEEFAQDMSKLLGPAKYIMPLVRPFARRWILSKSPYYKASRKA